MIACYLAFIIGAQVNYFERVALVTDPQPLCELTKDPVCLTCVEEDEDIDSAELRLGDYV